MADELRAGLLAVNQTVHGYREGHRLIEGSVKVAPSDARAMLVLSDASGGGGRIPAQGYLTGYPLPDSGKYVLARTWAAPEMSRPGCVWTHSLLIDFADLARLTSAADLTGRFVRPPGGAFAAFSQPVEIEPSRAATGVAGADSRRAGQWLGALYGRPKARIVADRDGSDDDVLVTAIWMQQWPRLRRTFRFCSFVLEDRSTSSEIFDLQLIDGTRSVRSRVPDGVAASEVEVADWVEPLLDDLERPSGSGLRAFLRNVGADVDDGRRAMAPLTRLYAAVEPGADPGRVAQAVSELERLGPGQGRLGRAAAAKVVLSRPDLSDPRLFEFAFEQVRSDVDLLGIDRALVGGALLRWRPDLLYGGVSDLDPLRGALDAALPLADPERLVDIIAHAPDAMSHILALRPDVLERPSLWRSDSVDHARVIRAVELDPEHAVAVVRSMIIAGRQDSPWLAIERYGVRTVLRGVSAAAMDGVQAAWSWLRPLAGRADDLAACMAQGDLTFRPLLIGLAGLLDPDAVPNSGGTDPWVTAVEHTRTSGDQAGEDLLAAFLLCRAMGWRSKSPGRLFFLSVQRLHEALAEQRLSEAAWRLADRRLPWVSPWREWDRCERLRRAVVDRFVDHELPPIDFGTVVDDGRLWAMLVDIAADGSRGRRYLHRVRKALRGGSEAWWGERARVIDRIVK